MGDKPCPHYQNLCVLKDQSFLFKSDKKVQKRTMHEKLAHSHTMTPFDAPGKQTF